MRRRVALFAAGALALAMSPLVAAGPSAASTGAGQARSGARPASTTEENYAPSLCQQRPFMCQEPYHPIGENGAYTGHDEPLTQFLSHRSGSGGASLTYLVRLPRNPAVAPTQAGTGGTWDFQRRATFWLGLPMCDTQSSPNFRDTCRANDDANALFRSTNPKSAHYIGKSPGNAYLELQFYTPGWVPQFDGFGCSRTKWCANLTIDSFSSQQNTGVSQNEDCLENHFMAGLEPTNWAYVTRSGKPQAPANPLALSDDPNGTGLSPDLSKDLLMNPGDLLQVHMHDTSAGYRVDITDVSTHQHGSMTASIANGFGHILFQPNAKKCHVAPYAFHPMYDTAVRRGTTWTAHLGGVAASDEIGHFEFCKAFDTNGLCTTGGATDPKVDVDDQGCLDGALEGALFPLKGCTLDDGDFDSPSYLRDWPGSFTDQRADRRQHGTPFMFTVPTTHGRPLERTAFESNLPNIERGEFGSATPECDAVTGAHCVNPPRGAKFYPIYTTTRIQGRCVFRQGGTHLPRTTRDFGGSSATEYGTKVLFVHYPVAGFKTVRRAEDFRRDLADNGC